MCFYFRVLFLQNLFSLQLLYHSVMVCEVYLTQCFRNWLYSHLLVFCCHHCDNFYFFVLCKDSDDSWEQI